MPEVEVTLFGFELEIVRRISVQTPPPPQLKVPRLRRLRLTDFPEEGAPVADEVLGDWATFDAEVYEHQGMGIYRRIA